MTNYPESNPTQYWDDLQEQLAEAVTTAPAVLTITQDGYPTQTQWEAAWITAGNALPIPARTRLLWRDATQWRGEFTVVEGDGFAIVAPTLNPTVIAGATYAADGSLLAFASDSSRPYSTAPIKQVPYNWLSYTKPTEPKQWLSWLAGGNIGTYPISRSGEISGAALYNYAPGDVPLERRLFSRRGVATATTLVSETADAYINGDEYYALFRSGRAQSGSMTANTMPIYDSYIHLAQSYRPDAVGVTYSWLAAGKTLTASQAFTVTVWFGNLTATPVDIVIAVLSNSGSLTHGTLSITLPANAPLTKYTLSGTTTGSPSGSPTVRYTFNTVLAAGGVIIWNQSVCLGDPSNLANYEAGPFLRGDGTFEALSPWVAPSLSSNIYLYRKVSIVPVLQKTPSVTRLIPVVLREDTGVAGDLAYSPRPALPILGIYNNILVIQCVAKVHVTGSLQVRIDTATGVGSVFTPSVGYFSVGGEDVLNEVNGDIYCTDFYTRAVTRRNFAANVSPTTLAGIRGIAKLVYDQKLYIQPLAADPDSSQFPVRVYDLVAGAEVLYVSPYPQFDAIRQEFLKSIKPFQETSYRSGSTALPEAGMLPLTVPIPSRLQKHPTSNEYLATFVQGESAVTAIISEEETTGRVRQITPAVTPYPDWWVISDTRFDSPLTSLNINLATFDLYNHEVLAIWLDSLTSAADTLKVQFNGDTGANYWYELKLGKAAAITNSESVAANYIALPSSGTDYPGSRLLLLPLYQKNGCAKTGLLLGGVNAALTTTNLTNNLGNVGWLGTAPITSIQISIVSTATFVEGGRITVAALKTRGRYNNNDIHSPALA